MGPDNATAQILKEKGFSYAENIYRFLFSQTKSKNKLKKGKEVWILDEAGKLGSRPLLEYLKLAEKYKAQLVFSGCSSQLPSVDRGGMFTVFCQKYGASVLEDIQRQKSENQRAMTKNLATGNMSVAIDYLVVNGGIKFSKDPYETYVDLITSWFADYRAFPSKSSLIIAYSNAEVRIQMT